MANKDSSTKEKIDAEADAAVKKFEDASQLGDQYFLYDSWAAWFINSQRKYVAPVNRIIIGDLQGNVLFDRNVVLTGLVDLIAELGFTLDQEADRLAGMPGYTIGVPHTRSQLTKSLSEAERYVKSARAKLEKLETIIGNDDGPQKSRTKKK